MTWHFRIKVLSWNCVNIWFMTQEMLHKILTRIFEFIFSVSIQQLKTIVFCKVYVIWDLLFLAFQEFSVNLDLFYCFRSTRKYVLISNYDVTELFYLLFKTIQKHNFLRSTKLALKMFVAFDSDGFVFNLF